MSRSPGELRSRLSSLHTLALIQVPSGKYLKIEKVGLSLQSPCKCVRAPLPNQVIGIFEA